MEGNTKFPTELTDEHANAGVDSEDKRRSQIKPKENMDEVGERLCIMVCETNVKQSQQTGNGHTSIVSQLSR